MKDDRDVRILTTPAGADLFAGVMTRRRLVGLGVAGVAGLGLSSSFLAACGGGDGGSVSGDPTASSFNLYTWAQYDDPAVLKDFGTITVDVYESNEAMIAKLEAAKGTSGFDMVVPTDGFIPQMVAKDLLQELDHDRIPALENVDPVFLDQAWDPGNAHSVPKDWGTTGWILDKEKVKQPLETWNDFIAAAQGEASGQTSVLAVPGEISGMYFWANGIDWNTEDAADLDAYESFAVNELAEHIKAFDSYPSVALTQGNYALSQTWNGDARAALVAVADAGGDPSRYAWGQGAPKTERWMDNWAIVKDAKNLDAAYNFLNFILTPENSVRDLEWHGYHTGVKGLEDLVPADLAFRDIVFFTPEELDRMVTGEVNTAQDRLVEIYNKVQAKAAG